MPIHPEITGKEIRYIVKYSITDEEAADKLGVSLLSFRMLADDYSILTPDKLKVLKFQVEGQCIKPPPDKDAKEKLNNITKEEMTEKCAKFLTNRKVVNYFNMPHPMFLQLTSLWGIERPSERNRRQFSRSLSREEVQELYDNTTNLRKAASIAKVSTDKFRYWAILYGIHTPKGVKK